MKIQRHAASFKEGTTHPLKASENAGPYGSGFADTPTGSASHATHPVLAEAESSIRSLASRMPTRNGDSGLCISPGPLEGPLLAKVRRDPRHGAQKEGCHNRRIQQGLGSAVRGQTDLLPLIWRGVGPAPQLPRIASSVPGLSILPAGHSGTPCASTLRQQVLVSYINHQGGLVSKRLCMLANNLLVWAQNNLRSLKAMHVLQCLFRGMGAPPARGSENLESLWQSSSRPLCLRRQLSLSNLFYKEHVCPGPWMAQPSALSFPPSRSATAGTQASQRATAQADSNSPLLEEPTVGVGVIPATESSPVADPLEMGPPFSSELHNMASTARVMGPTCVAARREPFIIPEHVLNTMAEARAPSTRYLYAQLLKWSIFSAWCQDRDLEPVTSDVSVVL